MTKKTPPTDPVRAYLSAIGRKGGQVKSDKKTKANRLKAQQQWAKEKAKKKEQAE